MRKKIGIPTKEYIGSNFPKIAPKTAVPNEKQMPKAKHVHFTNFDRNARNCSLDGGCFSFSSISSSVALFGIE
jgi:hypothetical protein